MEIRKNFKALVFDLDGTLYTGDNVYPGAVETINDIVKLGLKACYFTNNSTRSLEEYVERLSAMGFPAGIENIITSGDVTRSYVAENFPKRRITVFGTPALKKSFSENLEIDDENPEIAVLGFHNKATYDEMVNFSNALFKGIPYIATNPDKNCPQDPWPVPDAGSFLSFFEATTGRLPDVICGKPFKISGNYLCKKLGLDPQEIVFVGDRYSSDIMLAKNSGFFSVRVLTGANGELEPGGPPDLVIPSVADLEKYL